MTQWVEVSADGRVRGPRGLLRAWVVVLVSPARFFRERVAPGDQAPAFAFVVSIALVAASTHLALVPEARPVLGGRPALSAVLVVGVLALLVAPLGLHLVAAIQTALLAVFAPDRRGVSETVQVVAYATAPCAFAGLPVPALRVACGVYGALLLAVGTSEVHGLSRSRAAALAALPAALVFGYGFGGFEAVRATLDLLTAATGTP